MAYWGGHVQTAPKVYVVYWGWGEPGAFPSSEPCSPETITEGSTSATLSQVVSPPSIVLSYFFYNDTANAEL